MLLFSFNDFKAAPSDEPIDLYDDELLSDDVLGNEMYEYQVQFYNIFSPFYWYLKAALRTLKGVNCSIKEAINIKDEAEQFLVNIQACGADAVNEFKNVIASTKQVIVICDNIVHLKGKVCNNGESAEGKKTSPRKCTSKLFKQLYQLRNQIIKTEKSVKKLPAVPGDAAYCTNSAANLLIDVFYAYPSAVKNCSKLKN